MSDIPKNKYYCGKISLKLLFFRLTIKYFGTMRMPRLHHFNTKKIRDACPGPLAQIGNHIITGLFFSLILFLFAIPFIHFFQFDLFGDNNILTSDP